MKAMRNWNTRAVIVKLDISNIYSKTPILTWMIWQKTAKIFENIVKDENPILIRFKF